MTRRYDDGDPIRERLLELLDSLDDEQVDAVHQFVGDLTRAGDAHPDREPAGDDFEKHKAGMLSLYQGDERAARKAFAEARRVGWPPQATDHYSDPAQRTGAIGDPGRGAAGGSAFDRAEMPSGGQGPGGRLNIPPEGPFQGGDSRLRGVRTLGGRARMFSEADARDFGRKTAAGLDKMWGLSLSERELRGVIDQYARQKLVGG
jgi:hypothetical protein